MIPAVVEGLPAAWPHHKNYSGAAAISLQIPPDSSKRIPNLCKLYLEKQTSKIFIGKHVRASHITGDAKAALGLELL